MSTIYDVARLAGVSPATVSRVFNGRSVSPERVEAVRRAASELSFTPNRTARALRTQTTDVIALVIPDIENPYFTEVARGVEDVAQEAGFSVVLCNSDARVEKESAYVRIAVSERMAGVIIAAAGPDTDIAPLQDAGRPVVAVDRSTTHAVDRVIMANREAGNLATRVLLDVGRTRIACVAGPESVETSRDRAAGWRDALEEAGLTASDELLVHSTFQVDGGRGALARLWELPDPPDAIVAGNNLLGVGVIQALSEAGLTPPRVPVSVVGSLPFTTLSPSAVTVVRLPARRMGVTAARMLLSRIAGESGPPRTEVLHGEIESRPA